MSLNHRKLVTGQLRLRIPIPAKFCTLPECTGKIGFVASECFMFLTVFWKTKFLPESVQKSQQGVWEYVSAIIIPFGAFPDHFGPKCEKRPKNNTSNQRSHTYSPIKSHRPGVGWSLLRMKIFKDTYSCITSISTLAQIITHLPKTVKYRFIPFIIILVQWGAAASNILVRI